MADISPSALGCHWRADFFTTDVWTWRGLVTYSTVFVIDLASRRIQILGSTPYPNDLFLRQVGCTLSAADSRRRDHRLLICDRDQKWSGEVRYLVHDAGIRVVQTPPQAPNANAYAERFVRSIKHECLDRIIPLGAALPTIRGGICGPLSSRTESSGAAEPADRARPVSHRGPDLAAFRLGGLLNYDEGAA